MVVGLFIYGKEVDTLEIFQREDKFLLPLIPLARAIGASIEPSPPPGRLLTPLGEVTLQAGDIVEINGLEYLHQDVIEERLHITITFIQEEFAIALDVPWNPGAKKPSTAVSELEAQFHPTRFGISTIREKISYSELNFTIVSTTEYR